MYAAPSSGYWISFYSLTQTLFCSPSADNIWSLCIGWKDSFLMLPHVKPIEGRLNTRFSYVNIYVEALIDFFLYNCHESSFTTSVFIQIQKSFFQQVFQPNVSEKLKMVYTV